eukprot:1835997-Rhodomonas_salina.2
MEAKRAYKEADLRRGIAACSPHLALMCRCGLQVRQRQQRTLRRMLARTLPEMMQSRLLSHTRNTPTNCSLPQNAEARKNGARNARIVLIPAATTKKYGMGISASGSPTCSLWYTTSAATIVLIVPSGTHQPLSVPGFTHRMRRAIAEFTGGLICPALVAPCARSVPGMAAYWAHREIRSVRTGYREVGHEERAYQTVERYAQNPRDENPGSSTR